jgi:hypothetical protein
LVTFGETLGMKGEEELTFIEKCRRNKEEESENGEEESTQL